MSAMALERAPDRHAGRRTFALVAALLCLPFVVATVLWMIGWRPATQINHGELLLSEALPVRQISPADLEDLRGGARPLLDGRWSLALAVPAECGIDCVTRLQLARQVQVSLNKDMVRLSRGLLGPQLRDAATLDGIAGRWPDLAIARVGDAAWQTLGGARIVGPQLLLIDPQGRLVLRYGTSPDPKGVRRDVERLLKYSWNG
jgi:hypothetical protein